MSEGYEQKRISTLPSKHRRSFVLNSPYRTWRQIQSLAPGNEFRFLVVGDEPLPSEFTVRTGLHRGTLVHVRVEGETPETATLNDYTIQHVLSRNVDGVPFTHREVPLAQYQLRHGAPIEEVRRLLAP